MPPWKVREMRPRARRAMIRAQKKTEQQELGGNDKRKGKKREVEAELTEWKVGTAYFHIWHSMHPYFGCNSHNVVIDHQLLAKAAFLVWFLSFLLGLQTLWTCFSWAVESYINGKWSYGPFLLSEENRFSEQIPLLFFLLFAFFFSWPTILQRK